MDNPRLVTGVIALFALIELAMSLWMVAAPQSFFDQIGPFGEYNGHYLRDVAAFQAGIGAALLASIWITRLRAGAVCALLAASALHGINHFAGIDAANGNSNAGVVDAIAITLSVLVIGWLLAATLRVQD
ncbi:MAG: hypothetical protein HYX29_07985 [Solirubrobacterales bacterium]|nr:hypothetical protein [Solirubrobacterales bacterium]